MKKMAPVASGWVTEVIRVVVTSRVQNPEPRNSTSAKTDTTVVTAMRMKMAPQLEPQTENVCRRMLPMENCGWSAGGRAGPAGWGRPKPFVALGAIIEPPYQGHQLVCLSSILRFRNRLRPIRICAYQVWRHRVGAFAWQLHRAIAAWSAHASDKGVEQGRAPGARRLWVLLSGGSRSSRSAPDGKFSNQPRSH